MIKSILLAVDGSMYTEAVLQYGAEITKVLDAKVWVLSVADIRVFEWVTAVGSDGFVPMVSSGAYQSESQKLLEEKCEKVLTKCKTILAKQGISCETEKYAGSPVHIICDRMNIADLLILGRRGEFARWDTKMTGATFEALSRSCHKPMLMTLQDYTPISNLLVAYDGSINSNKALQYAGFLAASLKIPVTVLSVNDNEEVGKFYCEEAEKYLQSYDVKIATEVKPGQADKEIIQYIEEGDFNLLVIGAYGHSRIREAILGSTTQHILRSTSIPVLLAR